MYGLIGIKSSFFKRILLYFANHYGRRRHRGDKRQFSEFVVEPEIGRTPFVFLRKSFAVPYIRRLNNATFQQNNVRPYVATVTVRILEEANVNILNWSTR